MANQETPQAHNTTAEAKSQAVKGRRRPWEKDCSAVYLEERRQDTVAWAKREIARRGCIWGRAI
jgi:hypothetical protein